MPYLSALEVCSRRGAIQIHVYLTLPYTNITTFNVTAARAFQRLTDLEQIDFTEEAAADGDERLLRPLVEPVDARRVGDGRELATAHS